MSWAAVFDDLFKARPGLTYADVGAMTPDQTAHAMKLDSVEPDPVDVQMALLDEVARQLGLSQQGLANWPLADVAARASALIGADVPAWSVQIVMQKWVRAGDDAGVKPQQTDRRSPELKRPGTARAMWKPTPTDPAAAWPSDPQWPRSVITDLRSGQGTANPVALATHAE